MTVVGMANDGESARRLVEETAPDLVFLDVEMPKLSGVDLAASWRQRPDKPYVVFVTAFDRYAIRAFDLDALDYLVKPIDRHRLARSVERAKKAICSMRLRVLAEKIAAATATGAMETPPHDRHIVIRQRDELLRIAESDIFWLEAASQYVRVHTASADYIIAEPMNKYHAKLTSDAFVRVHRSAVVNVHKIERVLKKANGTHELQLGNGVRVPLSRSRKALVDGFLDASSRNRLHA